MLNLPTQVRVVCVCEGEKGKRFGNDLCVCVCVCVSLLTMNDDGGLSMCTGHVYTHFYGNGV